MSVATANLPNKSGRTIDDEPLYEIIDGQKVELPPMSYYGSLTGTRLTVKLGIFLETVDLGHLASETLFHLALPVDRNRRPDIAFVSYDRWPKDRKKDKNENAWDVVPNLGVEIVSPTDDAAELLDKIAEYFDARMQLVWVVYPDQSMIYAYESLTDVHGLTRSDVLDGGKVLPGFRLPLQELFPEK
jgi:Uma2 family endonuclease